MKAVKLSVPLLIEDTHRDAGDVVLLPDLRAHELVRLGFAAPSDSREVANPEAHDGADEIHPRPPAVETAAQAAAPRRAARLAGRAE